MLKITQEEKDAMFQKGFEPFYIDENTVSWKRIGQESKRKDKIKTDDDEIGLIENMHIVENIANITSDYE
jgi:DNA-nicking Smr family endonuclease